MKTSDIITAAVPPCFQSDDGILPTNRDILSLSYLEYLMTSEPNKKITRNDTALKIANHIKSFSFTTRNRNSMLR